MDEYLSEPDYGIYEGQTAAEIRQLSRVGRHNDLCCRTESCWYTIFCVDRSASMSAING